MFDISILNVLLYDRSIGTLTLLPGDKILFAFNQDYIDNPNRPTLSLSFKDTFGGLLTTTRPTQTRLPPFFSNLLPEGRMRDYLAERAKIDPVREFFLLQILGKDLPGALRIVPYEREPHRPEGLLEAVEEEPADYNGPLRFSLAGVQIKFSAIEGSDGRLTVAADGAGGAWILKLPALSYKGVPENEYSMMELARLVGIDVPETALVPIESIEGLPPGFERAGNHVYKIKRFDRSAEGKAVHIEDFAQIFGVYPDKKYTKASYRNIAEVIWAEIGEKGIVEFIRRFVFNALIGNGDMHLKNWSLIYPDQKTPELAPAYDFVSTLPYIPGETLALNFVDARTFDSLSLDQFKRFAAKAHLPEKIILDAVKDMVQAFKKAWRTIGDLPLDPQFQEIISSHFKTIPIWRND